MVIELNQNKGPEKASSNILQQEILRTAGERDEATKRLLAGLIPENKSVYQFINDACKFAGMKPPKHGEKLAPFIYKLQKEVCNFEETDSAYGCDGKLGPITFNRLLQVIPQLKVFSKEKRAEPFIAKRQTMTQELGLPSPPSHEAMQNPQKTVTIGDSLTYGFARYFYKGTDKYRKYNREYFKIGRSVATMRTQLEKQIGNLKNIPAFTIWGGTNDLSYRSAENIYAELERMYTIILENNPNAKIVAISLLPNAKYQRKVDEVNSRIREFAAKNQQNVIYLNLHDQLPESEMEADNVHIKSRGYKAVSKYIESQLTGNSNARLTDYLA